MQVFAIYVLCDNKHLNLKFTADIVYLFTTNSISEYQKRFLVIIKLVLFNTLLYFVLGPREKENMYNLTDNQKDILRWIVQEVRHKNLPEEFIVVWHFGDNSIIGFTGKEGDIPEITKGVLDLFHDNGLMFCRPNMALQSLAPYISSDTTRHCTLTGKAYEAVDSDFSAPDISFVTHLTPLADLTNLDDAIKKRCLPILGAGSTDPKLWDSAIRTAGVILEERLRDVGGISDENCIGQALVNSVFSNNGSLQSKFSVDSERQGYRDLYAGIVGAFRNPSSHRFIDPSPDEGGAFIVFVNLLLKMLEKFR
ncbi:MAG TPA: TIGR02391 family protein [Brevefilum sp.]|nr:TIGR02391 family protein [Brevefilum sp.]HPL69093.1 TIGR02391 family protein [Brevefilum sp.]